MLDFRVKTFLTACQLLNFTETARKLNLTQPAVSTQIRYLEREYGVKLFARDGQSGPDPAGKAAGAGHAALGQ